MSNNSKLEHVSLYCEKYPQIANCLMLVYLDLTLVKSWFEVNIEEAEQLQRCIIKGKQSQESMYEMILPCLSAEEWSIDRLTQLFSSFPITSTTTTSSSSSMATMKTPSAVEEESLHKNVILAVTFPDSTIVYYKLHEGIVPPIDGNNNDNEENDDVDDNKNDVDK